MYAYDKHVQPRRFELEKSELIKQLPKTYGDRRVRPLASRSAQVEPSTVTI